MTVDAAKVAQAYANTLKAANGAGTDKAGALSGAGDPTHFAGLVKDAMGGAVETLKASEAASAAAVAGEASLVDVVTAVSAAELTLETVVNVRDKMVNAYQEILRMPI